VRSDLGAPVSFRASGAVVLDYRSR